MKTEQTSSLILWAVLMSCTVSPGAGSLPERARVRHAKPGDLVIGGLFAMHFSVRGACDYGVLAQSLERSELMIFAVEQINNRSDLLPNVTLGFDIRDYCGDESVAASLALSMAGVIDADPGDGVGRRLVGIVGAGGSYSNLATAVVTTAYRIPVVAYRGSTIELSDKRRFPYFLRTWPSANLQAGAIVDVLLRFNWSYVGLVYSVNSYGIHGAQEVQQLADKSGICLAYSLPVRESASEHEIREIVDKIVEFKDATAVVFFTHIYSGADYEILQALWETEPDHPGLRLISSDTFGDVSTFVLLGVANKTAGSFAIRNYYREVPGFADYFQAAQAGGRDRSPWLRAALQSCASSGTCPLTTVGNKHRVVNAVYAFAEALDEILRADCGGRVACLTTNSTVTGEAVVSRLREITFDGVDGVFQFDEKGDPVGKYALYSQQHRGGSYAGIDVGDWDSRGATGNRLHIREGSLRWANGDPEVAPGSACREECRPGYKVIPLEEKCCYGCQRCPTNAVVVADGSRCVECDLFLWPSEDFAVCRAIAPSFVDWRNPVVIAVLSLSSAGIALTALAGLGMLHYRRHPLIKATGRELSFVNLVGLLVTYVSVFLILVYPTAVSCFASELLIALCLTLTFAPTMLKVNRIYRIFQAGKRTTKHPRFIGPRDQLVIASILTSVQLVICVCSLVWAPSLPRLYQRSKYESHVEIYCEFGVGFLASCAYNLLLVLACCFFAFKTRKVPSNYNESKFIAVSVYSTLVLCLAAVPVYATAAAVLQKVATLCVAILLNAFLTLVCVYLPKLYAVRFVKGVLVVADWRGRSRSEEASTSGSHKSQAGASADAAVPIAAAAGAGRPRRVKVHPGPSTVTTSTGTL